MRLTLVTVKAIVAASVAAGLAACVTVFPKENPAQLYEFGEASTAAPQQVNQAHMAVAMAPIDFQRAAAGDRILTVQGDETAYIKGARWVSAAPILFEAAVRGAFSANGGTARLLDRGEPARADGVLKLDVRAFEARYGGDMASAPTVRIEVYAALGMSSKSSDHTQLFLSEIRASDNRVSAIAQAFDQATGEIMAKLVPWVASGGQG